MKFTTPCCISKNILELRKKLEKLGYTRSSTFDETQLYIWTSGDKYYSSDNIPSYLNYGDYDPLYGYFCGESENSFLGIAALREDEDKHQWFTDGQGNWENENESELPSRYMQMEGHKATPKEILNFFRK